jgi:hypothetical protein
MSPHPCSAPFKSKKILDFGNLLDFGNRKRDRAEDHKRKTKFATARALVGNTRGRPHTGGQAVWSPKATEICGDPAINNTAEEADHGDATM